MQKGFTLVELIAVILLLAVLAITAGSRFVDLKSDAELKSFEALGGVLVAAANMAHMKQRLQGLGPNDPIEVDGVSIAMLNGYPRDNSIGLLVEQDGFTYQPNTGWFVWKASGSNNCRHDYNFAGWVGNPTPDKPNVVITRSGC